ncbi:MAG: hypothetical protein V6Z82_06770 [Flavobacteriales bacterium]
MSFIEASEARRGAKGTATPQKESGAPTEQGAKGTSEKRPRGRPKKKEPFEPEENCQEAPEVPDLNDAMNLLCDSFKSVGIPISDAHTHNRGAGQAPPARKRPTTFNALPQQRVFREAVPLTEAEQEMFENYKETIMKLVLSGRCKEMLGVSLTRDEVENLDMRNAKRYILRYEASLGQKTSDYMVDSVLYCVGEGVNEVFGLDDVEAYKKELRDDYLINNELKDLTGKLYVNLGSEGVNAFRAVAITAKHVLKSQKNKKKKAEMQLYEEKKKNNGRPQANFLDGYETA